MVIRKGVWRRPPHPPPLPTQRRNLEANFFSVSSKRRARSLAQGRFLLHRRLPRDHRYPTQTAVNFHQASFS